MTRFVTLMNPSRRRRRRGVRRGNGGRFISRRASRRLHSNPSRRRRRRTTRRVRTRTVYRTRTRTRFRTRRVTRRRRALVHRNAHHSAAMRRKISLAVKAANRRRSGGGGSRRRSVARRSFGGLRSGGGGFSGGSLISSFKSALSKQLLLKAGGAVAASLGTGILLSKFGSRLPLANHKFGRIIYTLGIPVTAAYLVRRKSRDLAEGLVIGGLVMTINTLMQGFKPASSLGSYSVAGELGEGSFGYYPQTPADTHGLGGGNAAFPGSAWD